MLSVPDQLAHITKVADWLELKAISSPDGRVGFGTLISATALTENEPQEDIGDEDVEEDRLVLDAQSEIARRAKHVGGDYPFRVDDAGRALSFVTPLTKVGSVYLFCLFLSHAHDRSILSKTEAPRVTNRTRDLFQACATIAAGGYVKGPAMSFGWPRPDGAGFLKALHRIYKLFGDGKPRKKPRVAAAKNVKDNGIDVIAWHRAIDSMPGTHYVIGQVASGLDWWSKSVVMDCEHFHKYWFDVIPGSQPESAMFIPFGLEPELPPDGTPYEDVLIDHVQSINYQFGTLFYRDRVAHYVGEGLGLVDAGESDIERHKDIPKVVRWVKSYSERLQAV